METVFEIFINSVLVMAFLSTLGAVFGFTAHALVQAQGDSAAELHD